MIDVGEYNKDSCKYTKLVKKLYAKYPKGITLPPEYAYFIQEDSIRFLIRLARYKFIARLLKKTDKVLEIGCGSGLGSIFLSQHCLHVLGIDVKSTEIEEAKAINKRVNVEFKIEDVFTFKKNCSYDFIIALDVIEHLSKEKGRKLITAMSKQLKPNGMVVIGTPSIYSFKYQGKLSKASHVKCYDLKELVAFVESCFSRTLSFSMNDEIVHTGFHKMAWYYFVLAFMPIVKK